MVVPNDPKTNELSPPAVLLVPPKTLAPIPIALLNLPPVTLAKLRQQQIKGRMLVEHYHEKY